MRFSVKTKIALLLVLGLTLLASGLVVAQEKPVEIGMIVPPNRW